MTRTVAFVQDPPVGTSEPFVLPQSGAAAAAAAAGEAAASATVAAGSAQAAQTAAITAQDAATTATAQAGLASGFADAAEGFADAAAASADASAAAISQTFGDPADASNFFAFKRQLYDVANAVLKGTGGPKQVGISWFIDSISGYWLWPIKQRLDALLGVAGYVGSGPSSNVAGTVGSSGITIAASSGAYTINGSTYPYDYTYWPTGIHSVVPAGGVLEFSVGGGAYLGNYFAAYLVNRAGGGTCKVELVNNSGVVQETIEASYSTDGATGLYKAATTLGAAAARKIRVTGLTGTTIVATAAMINKLANGVIWTGLNRGGLGLDQWQTAASSIWKGVVADNPPHLLVYTGRESPELVQAHLGAVLDDWATAAPGINVLLNGVWPYGDATNPTSDYGKSKDAAPSWLEQEAIRAVAEAKGYSFLPLYDWIGDPARKANPNDVHLTDAEGTIFAGFVQERIGLRDLDEQLGGYAYKQASAALETRSITLRATGDKNDGTDALVVSQSGGLDTTFSFRRNAFLDVGNGIRTIDLGGPSASSNPTPIFRASANNLNGLANVASWTVAQGWAAYISNHQLVVRYFDGTRVREVMLGGRRVDSGGAVAGSGASYYAFANADTGFSQGDMNVAGEIRISYDVANQRTETIILQSGGIFRRQYLPYVNSANGAGTGILTFSSTATNFTAGANYGTNELRFALDATSKQLKAKVYEGTAGSGTLRDFALLNQVAVPATATSAGNVGDFAADASYLYICTAANTWRRVAVAAW